MKQQLVTSLPISGDNDRRNRMIKYSITMGIRMICIALMLFAQGWWLIVFASGAIVLPYFAVVIANVGRAPRKNRVLRPGTLHTPDAANTPGGTADTPGDTANMPHDRAHAPDDTGDTPESTNTSDTANMSETRNPRMRNHT